MTARGVPPELCEAIAAALPGATVLEAVLLEPDSGAGAATEKTLGYGAPLKLRLRLADGAVKTVVFHTATANVFGHDRRADRAGEMLLAYDTFGVVPAHVAALDVGAIARDGKNLISLRDAGEFYLLSEWAEGHLYADELRAIRERRALVARDVQHCENLARYLAELHRAPLDNRACYKRAIRDLVGSGEGIFGIIDGYPPEAPGAGPARLCAIERRVLDWRWRLREHGERLRRTHGDFHPFNIVFGEDSELSLLDTSRGSLGDPADDVSCLAINYLFFALDAPGAWKAGFRELWLRFFHTYEGEARDPGLRETLAPFFAWRGLVLANPAWYGSLSEQARDRLLGFVESVLATPCFRPELADEVFS